jgi:hypothetical protein
MRGRNKVGLRWAMVYVLIEDGQAHVQSLAMGKTLLLRGFTEGSKAPGDLTPRVTTRKGEVKSGFSSWALHMMSR